MKKPWILVLGLAAGAAVMAQADLKPVLSDAANSGYAVRNITPVYSQLVSFGLPAGFAPAYENASGGQYLQEMVPKGETVEKWSQMITLTGAKDLATNPRATPQVFASLMAQRFQSSCPASFSVANLGAMKIGVHDAQAVVMACGSLTKGADAYSEAMLMLAIRGEKDFYTVQWAERGVASPSPIALDTTKWRERMSKLEPIRICPRIAAEAAPYPSCM